VGLRLYRVGLPPEPKGDDDDSDGGEDDSEYEEDDDSNGSWLEPRLFSKTEPLP
jgi:hypothetical protein